MGLLCSFGFLAGGDDASSLFDVFDFMEAECFRFAAMFGWPESEYKDSSCVQLHKKFRTELNEAVLEQANFVGNTLAQWS